MVRTVVQLLRLAAENAATRLDTGELGTADDRLGEALGVLDKVARIQKAVGQIRSSAVTIDTEADTLRTELTRVISQARAALAGVVDEMHRAACCLRLFTRAS